MSTQKNSGTFSIIVRLLCFMFENITMKFSNMYDDILSFLGYHVFFIHGTGFAISTVQLFSFILYEDFCKSFLGYQFVRKVFEPEWGLQLIHLESTSKG